MLSHIFAGCFYILPRVYFLALLTPKVVSVSYFDVPGIVAFLTITVQSLHHLFIKAEMPLLRQEEMSASI